LGSSGRRRATDELSRFSQDRLTQQKRKEANRPQQLGKQDKPLEAQEPRGTKVEAGEERDPLANLTRLEPENRPGFHWRGTRNVKTLVQGTEDSNDKNNR